jgi:hypothetical protein
MPEYEYHGPGERVYPETRDALGAHLGLVGPGDVRHLDEAPDQWWTPCEGAGEGDDAGAAEGDAPDLPDDPEPAPGGPVPAPPAVIPGA